MERIVSRYKNNALASKKKHIYSRLLDYFSTFVLGFIVFVIANAILLNIPSISGMYRTLNKESTALADYVDSTRLQMYNQEKTSLISVDDSGYDYVVNITKTSAYIHELQYPYYKEDGTYEMKDVPIEETFLEDEYNYPLDNISYYFKKVKADEPSLNSYVYQNVDYRFDIDTYLYEKIMKAKSQFFVSEDDTDFVIRGGFLSRYVVFNKTYTEKMINRVGKGEKIDSEAVNCLNRVIESYGKAVQFGIKEIEDKSDPYKVIYARFYKVYRNICWYDALTYLGSYLLAYLLLTLILRLITKQWVTLGQKVLNLAMCSSNEMELSPIQIIGYHALNFVLFGSSSVVGLYFANMAGVLSLQVIPYVTVFSIALFVLVFNLISLFMPLWTKNRHDISTFITRISLKDINEFEALVEVISKVEEDAKNG